MWGSDFGPVSASRSSDRAGGLITDRSGLKTLPASGLSSSSATIPQWGKDAYISVAVHADTGCSNDNVLVSGLYGSTPPPPPVFTSAVPEPSSVLMLATALIAGSGVILLRRRRALAAA